MTTAQNVQKFLRANDGTIGMLNGVKMANAVWERADRHGIIGSGVVFEILGEKLANRFFQESTTGADHLELGLEQIRGAERIERIEAERDGPKTESSLLRRGQPNVDDTN